MDPGQVLSPRVALPQFVNTGLLLRRADADDDDLWRRVALFEELGKLGHSVVGLAVLVHTEFVLPLLAQGGSDVVRARFLGPGTAGTAVFSGSLSTRGQAVSGAVTALEVNGGYRLNGAVPLMMNAHSADAHCVVARLGSLDAARDTAAFLIPADVEGVAVRSGRADCNGPTAIASVYFKDVQVPAEYRLVADTPSPSLAVSAPERLLAACLATGAASGHVDATRDHSRKRHTFGVALQGHQGLRLRLAELRTEVEASRQLNYGAALAVGTTGGGRLSSFAARLRAARVVRRAAVDCLTIFGAAGYMAEHRASRFVESAYLVSTACGTSEAVFGSLAEFGDICGR
jgi:alkylation response protein AidB-like acyl-CoA dehydrogenase